MINNDHVLDIEITDEQANAILTDGNFMTFEEFEREINAPIPFYIDLYRLFRYRIPYRVECAINGLKIGWQRGRHGYADSDVWGMYIYIAHLINRMSIELANEAHGYPPNVTDMTEWKEILDKIGKAFAIVEKREQEGSFLSDDDKLQLDEAFNLMRDNFLYMWD